MTSVAALESVGLFARASFMPAPERARLVAAIAAGARTKGTVATEADVHHLDERIRKVWCADVGRTLAAAMRERLSGIRPELEHRFQRPLGDFEGPDFLVYEPGAFYTPHRDSGTFYESRQVSLVMFLNGARDRDCVDGYEGGELTFHGLLDGPVWTNCPIRVAGEPGLLIAFLSATLHEVRPVTEGRRCSVVGWFNGRA